MLLRLVIFLPCLIILSSYQAFAQDLKRPHALDFVTGWTALAASELMTFGFYNIEETKKENEKYFTNEGYDSFYKALDESRTPEMIKKNKILMSGAIMGTPIIVQETIKNGKYKWNVTFPYVLTYQSSEKVKVTYLDITAIVTENTKNEHGLGIDQWIAISSERPDKILCSSDNGVEAQELIKLRRENQSLKDRIKNLEKL